ncbi:MAG: Holliday junction resolvase RuvX [Chloroflexi bacterium]|nr:Holliday junction resolvase RuvX [Chloroflexota bacterium]
MTRVLGLDVGERRIGVAISTPEGGLAVPLRVLERSEESADLRAIAELAVAENATTIVVGHPISLDGSRGAQARSVEAFARSLAETSGLAVELTDERFTSTEAKRGRNQSSRSQRARRAPVDDLAAAIILQAYLDRRRHAAAPDPTAPDQ